MPPDNLCPTYSSSGSKPWDHKVIAEGLCVGSGACVSNLPEPEPEFEEEGEDM